MKSRSLDSIKKSWWLILPWLIATLTIVVEAHNPKAIGPIGVLFLMLLFIFRPWSYRYSVLRPLGSLILLGLLSTTFIFGVRGDPVGESIGMGYYAVMCYVSMGLFVFSIVRWLIRKLGVRHFIYFVLAGLVLAGGIFLALWKFYFIKEEKVSGYFHRSGTFCGLTSTTELLESTAPEYQAFYLEHGRNPTDEEGRSIGPAITFLAVFDSDFCNTPIEVGKQIRVRGHRISTKEAVGISLANVSAFDVRAYEEINE